MSTLWRDKFLIKWSMTLKVIQGHIRPPLYQNHSSTFVYGPILMKICMNANIMKTQYMTWNVTFMLWRSFVIFYFKTFRPIYNLDLRYHGQHLFLFLHQPTIFNTLNIFLFQCPLINKWIFICGHRKRNFKF